MFNVSGLFETEYCKLRGKGEKVAKGRKRGVTVNRWKGGRLSEF